MTVPKLHCGEMRAIRALKGDKNNYYLSIAGAAVTTDRAAYHGRSNRNLNALGRRRALLISIIIGVELLIGICCFLPAWRVCGRRLWKQHPAAGA